MYITLQMWLCLVWLFIKLGCWCHISVHSGYFRGKHKSCCNTNPIGYRCYLCLHLGLQEFNYRIEMWRVQSEATKQKSQYWRSIHTSLHWLPTFSQATSSKSNHEHNVVHITTEKCCLTWQSHCTQNLSKWWTKLLISLFHFSLASLLLVSSSLPLSLPLEQGIDHCVLINLCAVSEPKLAWTHRVWLAS